ncbi:MAG: oxidoreductase [Actinobacteria bacterium]|nr:oxidoreductase [Actinomycetota bacterium]
MDTLLILGGTAWLGRELARQAVASGVDVTCLARGTSGPVADGAHLIPADRSEPSVYESVRGRDWDAVIDVSWQPDHVRSALDALAADAGHWTYVSSVSVYADTTTPGANEAAALVEPMTSGLATMDEYGEAKVGCEQLVTAAMGADRSLLARAGLIGGPGDPTDRFGYWVSRFASASSEAVLVPDAPDLSTQVVDVRDLAAFLLACAGERATGPVNVVGEAVPFSDVVDMSALTAGFTGRAVRAAPQWLEEHEVQPWAGPRSLPLWLPLPEYACVGSRSDARALALGLQRRSLEATLADVLADEVARGLGRARQAGLTRVEERTLLAQLR